MDLSKWITVNNELLIQTTKNITSNSEDSMDLYQCVIEQLLERPEKMDYIEDEQKLYYFIRVIKTNYLSKTSPFRYHEEKYKRTHIKTDNMSDYDNEDLPYKEDIPDREWIRGELDKMGWFEADLFNLWLDLGTLINVHKETTIPINSVGKYIKDIKAELNCRWIKHKKNKEDER